MDIPSLGLQLVVLIFKLVNHVISLVVLES